VNLLEIHSQEAHNEIASLMRLRLCWINSPGRCFNTDRGFVFHTYIMLDPLMEVKYNQSMARKKLPPEIKAYFVKMGSRGGKLGGRIRADSLTPERRKEIAQRASAARWARQPKSHGV
jgi:hypothetical protein